MQPSGVYAGGNATITNDGYMMPGNNDAVLSWKPAVITAMNITARWTKVAAGGDGVTVSILKNSVLIWNLTITDTDPHESNNIHLEFIINK